MEVVGFTLGVLASVQQAITTAESLKHRYEAFRQNPKDIERLLTSYQSFAGDLHAMDKQFRGKLYSIPQPQRRIFERHFAGMVESFDSSREKLDEVSAKISRGRLLRVLRAKAQSDVCGELLRELRRVEGILFDINTFLATANVIESVKEEILAAGDVDQFRPSFPILTASPDIVLDFDSIDEHGNPANVWEVATGRETGEEYSEVGRQGITGIELTSDGDKLVFTSLDGSLRIIDRRAAKEIAVLVGHVRGISCLAMGENGKQVYSGSNDRTIRIWDLVQTDANPDILTGHTHWIRRLFVSKDRDRLISVSCVEIRVWNIKRRECVRFLNREDAHTMSERDIYEAVGEECSVGKNLDVPLHGRRVLWRESGVDIVLGTLEADVADWCFSPSLSTVCIGLASGQVAFYELQTKT